MNSKEFEQRINALLAQRETTDVEYKQAKGGFPGSFWETYSAFANTHGGTIVLGVKEKDGMFFVDGLTADKAYELRKKFWDNAHNPNTVSLCLLSDNDIETVKVFNDVYVLLFNIPQAHREQLPVYIKHVPLTGTYRRDDSGDYLCTPNEVRRMYADADTSRPADSRILANYSWDDIDIPSLDQYRRLFAASKPNHAWLSLDNKDLLRRLGGYRKDRTKGTEGFTLAGLLMFGKYQSIIDNECAPHYFPEYRLVDEGSNARWTDRIYPDGTWEANLFQFFRRVLPKLQQSMPVPFTLRGNQRFDTSPAHEALREAFANLCVHADYSEDSSLVITHAPGKIVFSNPGTLLISRHQFYQGGESVCRNTSLQQMFMMIGNVEKAGSGVDKILKGWETMKWKAPYPNEKVRPNKVELVMPLESLFDENAVAALKAQYGIPTEQINRQELTALLVAMSEKVVNNMRIKEVLAIHSADATTLLQSLCQRGWLVQSGRGRGSTYSLEKEKTLQPNLATSAEALQPNLATSAEALQPNLATSARKHVPFNETKQAIANFCLDWRTADQIAAHLGKSSRYVRNEILPKMSDTLEMKYTTKNHPAQMYRTRNEAR